MMRKNILHILTIVITLSMVSCEKFFDQELYQSIETDNAILSIDDAQVALNGCYNGLQNVELFARDLLLIADLAADNSKLNTTNSGRFINIYQWNILPSNEYLTGIWNNGYQTIYLANKLIADVDELTGVDEDERNRIVGEAKVIRSILYFQLVNFFAQDYNYTPGSGVIHYGVPYITAPIGLDFDPGRDLVEDVYKGILLDLEGSDTEQGAIDLLDNATSSPFYINVWAAKALLSRVYLYMVNPDKIDESGTYLTKARDYADEVIQSRRYALVPRERFMSSWYATSEEENEELIFTLRFSSIDNASVDMLADMYMEEGYGDVLASNDLVNLFEENDIRSGWFRSSDNEVYIEKFPGKESESGVQNISVNNHPLFRLAELYLNVAEAEVLLNNDIWARAYLNTIRNRAGASILTSTSGSALLDSIKLDRRRELCFEGHRLWDIKRWHDDLVRKDVTNPNVINSIEYPSYLFAYPIPEREIEANSTIRDQQNPGY